MNEKIVTQIQATLNSKETEKLLEIYKKNNKREWAEEAFEAMRRILKERGENIPDQDDAILPLKSVQISKEWVKSTGNGGLFSNGFFGLLDKGPMGWIIFGLFAGFMYGAYQVLMEWIGK